MRSAIAEGLRDLLDDAHLHVALEFWDMLYAQQEKHNLPHFLETVGKIVGITDADQVKARQSVMSALSRMGTGERGSQLSPS